MAKKASGGTRVWLAMDPETRRITAQERDWQDGDFPPGPRGQGWPRREYTVPAQTWTKVLRATYDGEQQDRLHRDWWNAADPTGPQWPMVP